MRFFFLLLPLALSLLAQAQSWAPAGAQWTYKQGSCCGPDTNLAVISAVGDTLIDGRTCTKLAVEEGWFGCYAFLEFFAESNDSLFHYDTSTGEFQLLFRWNALPGDTWYTAISDGSTLNDTLDWTVLDTGSVVIDGMTLRTWDVQALTRYFLFEAPIGFVTERLGPFGSPFTWVNSVCDGETFLQLRCYEDNDLTWQNPAVPQCGIATHVAEEQGRSVFGMGPNPVSAGGTVHIELAQPAPARLHVRDASGREVLHATLSDGRTSFALTTPGIYLVAVEQMPATRAQERLVVR